jgi:hypothetical protein
MNSRLGGLYGPQAVHAWAWTSKPPPSERIEQSSFPERMGRRSTPRKPTTRPRTRARRIRNQTAIYRQIRTEEHRTARQAIGRCGALIPLALRHISRYNERCLER